MPAVDECIAIRQYIKSWTKKVDGLDIQIEGPKLFVSNILDYSVIDAAKELRKYESIRCVLYSYSFGCMPQGEGYESPEGAGFQDMCSLLFSDGAMTLSKKQLVGLFQQLYGEFTTTPGFEEYAKQLDEIFEAIRDIPDAKLLGSALLLVNKDGSDWDLREDATLGERFSDSVLGKIGSAQASAMNLVRGTDNLERVGPDCGDDTAVERAMNSEEWAEMSKALAAIGCLCRNVKPHELEVRLTDTKQVPDATGILNNYNVRYELSLFTTESFKADNMDESLMVSAKILPGMSVDKAVRRLESIRIEDREAGRELAARIRLVEPSGACTGVKLLPMLNVYAEKKEEAPVLEDSVIARVLAWAKKNHVEACVYSGFVVLAPMAIMADTVAEYTEGLMRIAPSIRVVNNCATLCGRLLSEQTAAVLQSSGIVEGMQAESLCEKWLKALQKFDGGPSPKSTWVLKELLMNCKKMGIWCSKLRSFKDLLQIFNNKLKYNSVVICDRRRRDINPFMVPPDMGAGYGQPSWNNRQSMETDWGYGYDGRMPGAGRDSHYSGYQQRMEPERVRPSIREEQSPRPINFE